MRHIVDAHHHLWDLEACHYPWLMARGVKRFFGDPTPIQKNYLVADLRRDAADYALDGSVHVQVGVAPTICRTPRTREQARWASSIRGASGRSSSQ